MPGVVTGTVGPSTARSRLGTITAIIPIPRRQGWSEILEIARRRATPNERSSIRAEECTDFIIAVSAALISRNPRELRSANGRLLMLAKIHFPRGCVDHPIEA